MASVNQPVSPAVFVRLVAESMENDHYMHRQADYITEAFIDESLKGRSRVDEGFVDILKTLIKPITWPIEKIANFWKKDREFVNEVAKAEKKIPKHVVAALYSDEFADTNIVQDLWDMLCMLKDVVLFRYRHIPWRTAISAAALIIYYLSPWNQTWGTALVSWLKGLGIGNGNIGPEFLGDGNTLKDTDNGTPFARGDTGDGGVFTNHNKFTYDNVDLSEWKKFNADGLPVDADGEILDPGSFAPAAWNSPEYEFPADQKFNIAGDPVDADGKALPLDMFHKAGTSGGEGVGGAGSVANDTVNIGNAAKLDADAAVDTESGKMVMSSSNWSDAGEAPEIGTTYTLDNGSKVTIVGYADETFNGHPCKVPLVDMNGDGEYDIAIRPSAEEVAKWGKAQVGESLIGLGIAGGAAALAGLTYWKTNKEAVVAAAEKAAPYLNYLDELLITFLLWKWFKKDLKDYRKWLVTKKLVKEKKTRKV